jgi:hypothetical protein
MGGKRNGCKVLARKHEEKEQHGTPSHRRNYNNKMDLRGIEWDGMEWNNQTLDSEKWCTEHGNKLWLLKNVGDLLTS